MGLRQSGFSLTVPSYDLNSIFICLAIRSAKAIIVYVGFANPDVGNTDEPAIYKFLVL